MARKRTQEIGFGSDSFLDVLCNMVGILVILIVIAGLRVSRAPVVIPEVAATIAPAPPTVLDDPVELGEPETMVWAVEVPPPKPILLPSPKQPAKLAPLNPPRELVDESHAIQADIEAISIQINDLDATSNELAQRTAIQTEELDKTQILANTAQSDMQSNAEQARSESQNLTALREQLESLDSELREARASAPKVKILKHSTTPISRIVSGTEVHFRLINNQVSVVPVDILIDRLQAQIQRQKEFLLTREYFESSVGPIDGYKMEFTLERAKATPVEELNMGGRLIKMEVTGWMIHPDQGIIFESAEQALTEGSSYLRAIESAGANATLTYWVYPDSFDAHRQLQEHAQARSWRVAARPLPEGVPIAGSPKGSKSLSQ